jgi:hypothetical protein
MNNLLAVMEAVSNSVAAGSNQQLADGLSTNMNVGIEQGIYNHWQAEVTYDSTQVSDWAGRLAGNPGDAKNQGGLTQAQAKFQNDETSMQTYTQQADSATQATQNQAGQDASTMQQKVQLEAAVNQTLQTLTSILGQHY